MTGVVLCGGQSARMKTDKGLITLNRFTWAQSAFNKLTEFKMPVFVSINSGQYKLKNISNSGNAWNIFYICR